MDLLKDNIVICRILKGKKGKIPKYSKVIILIIVHPDYLTSQI